VLQQRKGISKEDSAHDLDSLLAIYQQQLQLSAHRKLMMLDADILALLCESISISQLA
jgi:hypothetical protein